MQSIYRPIRHFDFFERSYSDARWDGVQIEYAEEGTYAWQEEAGYVVADSQYADIYPTLAEALREYAGWIENTVSNVVEMAEWANEDLEADHDLAAIYERAEAEMQQARSDAAETLLAS